MEPKFVTRSAFTLVGMTMRVKPQGKVPGQLWDEFGPRMSEIQHTILTGVAYGVSDNMEMATGQFDYSAGLEVDSTADMPAGMVALDVPAQTYAVFSCTIPTIRETYQDIYGIWLPTSGYVRAPGPELELYSEAFNSRDPASVFDVYIPVLKD